MKKLLGILVLGLLWNNNLCAKNMSFDNNFLMNVSNNYEKVLIEDPSDLESVFGGTQFFSELDQFEPKFYFLGQKKVIDFINLMIEGGEEAIFDHKWVKSIIKKMEKQNLDSYDDEKYMKFLYKEMINIVKKEKIENFNFIITSQKKISDSSGEELFDVILEHQNMNVSELKVATNEYRKLLTGLAGDNKTILLNDEMTLILNKFEISKNSYNNEVFVKLYAKANYVFGSLKIKTHYNVFAITHNDYISLVLSECWVNCSKHNQKFNKMIKPMFSTKASMTSSSTTKSTSSNESNLIEQLNSLNELYKSGVLTKEEFEKAKKKLLN